MHAELKIPGMRDTCGMPPSVPINPTVIKTKRRDGSCGDDASTPLR